MLSFVIGFNALLLVLNAFRFNLLRSAVYFLLLLGGIPYVGNIYNRTPEIENRLENEFTLLSLNVNLYEKGQLDMEKGKRKFNALMAEIQKLDPDILFLQEVYSPSEKGMALFLEDLRNKGYNHYVYGPSLLTGNHKIRHFTGTAIVSKNFPIKKTLFKKLYIPSTNSILIGEIEIGNKTIHLVNVHLQSFLFRFNSNDTSQTKLDRLINSYHQRAKQVRLITDSIINTFEEGEIIVAGDFNDPATGYVFHEMKTELQSAFEQGGDGFAATWPADFPIFKIDHCFLSSSLEALNVRIVKMPYTDHRGLFCRIAITSDG